MTFTALGLKKPILDALSTQGYEEPTPIQRQVIPAIMAGRNVIGIAQTGTGKTAAFLLPLLHYLSGDSRSRSAGEARVLILSPTRELAIQIHKASRDYSVKLAVRSTCVMGGVSIRPQLKTMAGGVDVLVATPGRLEDLEQQGAIALNTVEAIVLDEADQMLDIGFMPAIRRILAKCKNNKQTLLFSATMPKEIRQLTKQYLTNPVEISVAPVTQTADKVEQKVMHVAAGVKISAVIHIARDYPDKRILLFTRTKRGADKVVRRLKHEKLDAAAIHGNKSQNQREKTLAAFRDGGCPILIATDIAARGIDVPGIELVINYDLPHVAEVYVHRIGRTARAGASGLAIILCAPEERDLLKKIERLVRLDIPVMATPRDLPMPLALPPRQRQPQGKPKGRSKTHPGGRVRPGGRAGARVGKQGGKTRRAPGGNDAAPQSDEMAADMPSANATRNSRPGKKSANGKFGHGTAETGTVKELSRADGNPAAAKKRKPRWRGGKSAQKHAPSRPGSVGRKQH